MARSAIVIIGALLSICSCAQKRPVTVVSPPPFSHPTIYFRTASDIPSASEINKLTSNVEKINANKSAVLILVGHTDERGSKDYNLYLGDRRARNVMDLINKLGIKENLPIVIVSKGEDSPVDTRHIRAAWAKNRRVEFIFR